MRGAALMVAGNALHVQIRMKREVTKSGLRSGADAGQAAISQLQHFQRMLADKGEPVALVATEGRCIT